MTQATTVGIVIPVWNRASTLPRAIEAALAQGPDDIVVINDASTDDSLSIAEAYAASHGVRVVTHPKKSTDWIAAMRPTFDSMDCDYVMCIGADDVLYGNFVELVRLVASVNPGVVWSDYALLREGTPLQVIETRRYGFSEARVFTPDEAKLRFQSRPDFRAECGSGTAVRRDMMRWLNEEEYWVLGPWADSIGYTVAAIRAGCVYLPGVHGGFVVQQSEPSYHQRVLQDANQVNKYRRRAEQWLSRPAIRPLIDNITFTV